MAMQDKSQLDPNVQAVMDNMKHRAEVGMKKYGTTTFDNPLTLIAWLRHLQQELMDGAVYTEAAIKKIESSDGFSVASAHHAEMSKVLNQRVTIEETLKRISAPDAPVPCRAVLFTLSLALGTPREFWNDTMKYVVKHGAFPEEAGD